MPTATYAGHDVAVNDEGFLADPGQWTEEMAPQIARSAGIDELTPRHWQVIRFMRAQGQPPASLVLPPVPVQPAGGWRPGQTLLAASATCPGGPSPGGCPPR